MSDQGGEAKAACGESSLTAGLEQLLTDVQASWLVCGLGPGTLYGDFAMEVAKRAVMQEREACAQIVDVEQGVEAWEIHGGQETIDVLRDIAAAIRARSNA